MKKSTSEALIKAAPKVFFVDPMSYSNLALYDYSLLSNIKNIDLHYFCNAKYDSNELNIEHEKIYNYSDKTKVLKVLSYIKSQFVLFKSILSYKPKVVHFQWLKIPDVDYFFLRLIRKRNIKIILTAHDVLPHNSGDRFKKIYKKIYATVDAIIVHSSNTKIELVESLNVSEEKIYIIPHGVLDIGQNIDTEKVDFYIKKFRSDFNLGNKLVFSALGTINDYKGINFIVDAWKQNNISKNEDFKLIIAGKGELKKIKELNGNSNVIIENRFLLVEEFLALLRLTDFVLLPYKKISQSGILLTAINEKKRVIVSNVGGLTDPFKFGKIGYVLSELNSNTLNKAIVEAGLNADSYPNEETWEKIFKYFDWANIGDQTKNLYNEITP